MNNYSIKKKLTFWYSILLLVILICVLMFLFFSSDTLIKKDQRADLIRHTDSTLDDVRIIKGKLTIDDDLAYYYDGIYTTVAKSDGALITGLYPEGFPANTPFKADTVQNIKHDHRSFFVYDRLLESTKHDNIWIRGVVPSDLFSVAPAIGFMLKIFFIIFPILILIAILGGYFITRKAFVPLTTMVNTATDIQSNHDFSRRIPVEVQENSNDEIYVATKTFNAMLDSLEQSFQSEKQFTNDASHELRTPTSVIMSQCEYALEHINNPKEMSDALKVILEQSHKMSSLVSQLLTFARADNGTVRLDFKDNDIGLILEETLFVFEKDISQKEISIVKSIPMCIIARVDHILISRLFENIISNAIKFTPYRGKITITLSSSETTFSVSVKDTGCGIPPEDLPNIWNRFYQGENGIEHNIGSSLGLGLSMSKWIAEAHNGNIKAISTLASGSEFIISIPNKNN